MDSFPSWRDVRYIVNFQLQYAAFEVFSLTLHIYICTNLFFYYFYVLVAGKHPTRTKSLIHRWASCPSVCSVRQTWTCISSRSPWPLTWRSHWLPGPQHGGNVSTPSPSRGGSAENRPFTVVDWLMINWLMDWLIDWWLIDWLIDWWLIDWLIVWLMNVWVSWIQTNHNGWLTDWLIDWFNGG